MKRRERKANKQLKYTLEYIPYGYVNHRSGARISIENIAKRHLVSRKTDMRCNDCFTTIFKSTVEDWIDDIPICPYCGNDSIVITEYGVAGAVPSPRRKR